MSFFVTGICFLVQWLVVFSFFSGFCCCFDDDDVIIEKKCFFYIFKIQEYSVCVCVCMFSGSIETTTPHHTTTTNTHTQRERIFLTRFVTFSYSASHYLRVCGWRQLALIFFFHNHCSHRRQTFILVYHWIINEKKRARKFIYYDPSMETHFCFEQPKN